MNSETSDYKLIKKPKWLPKKTKNWPRKQATTPISNTTGHRESIKNNKRWIANVRKYC